MKKTWKHRVATLSAYAMKQGAKFSSRTYKWFLYSAPLPKELENK